MIIRPESLIFTITILVAAAVGLCYLQVASDIVSAITERQRKRRSARQSAKQLERKLLSCHQEILEKIEAQAKTDLGAVLGKIEGALAEQLTALSGRYSKEMEETVQDDYQKNRQELKTAAGKSLDETKIALAGLVQSAEKRVDEELTKELKTTRVELENYKKKQIKKIDEEIATIVEKTIYLTLGKGLSLKDQVDIIYESLAEAKEGGFFEKNAE